MPKHGTALTVGQFAEFSGAVLKALPRNIHPTTALKWAQNGKELAQVLERTLCPTTEPFPIIVFYDKSLPDLFKECDFKRIDDKAMNEPFEMSTYGQRVVRCMLIHLPHIHDAYSAKRWMMQRNFAPANFRTFAHVCYRV